MEINQKIVEEISKKIHQMLNEIDLTSLQSQKKDLEDTMKDPGFWSDTNKAKNIQRDFSIVENSLETYRKLQKLQEDIQLFYDLYKDASISENDKKSIENNVQQIADEIQRLSLKLYLNGKYDKLDAIMTIKSGQGGTEAQDWVSMLYRMYLRYCNAQNWKIEIIDEVKGEEAGYTTVILQIIGEFAYGYLKKETGVHRLVRISPFNAQGLRQTSFASVEVMPVIEDIEINEIEIKPEDIEFKATLSSGPGGQSVNTTASAVRLTHKPTGIVVTCSALKSQQQNKDRALQILKSKLWLKKQEELENEKASLKKDVKMAQWGNQIRNYVLNPYKLIKDLRTGIETSNVDAILDGEIQDFINAQVLLK